MKRKTGQSSRSSVTPETSRFCSHASREVLFAITAFAEHFVLAAGAVYAAVVAFNFRESPPGAQDYWDFSHDNLTGSRTKFGESNKVSAAKMTFSQWDHY